MTNFGTYSTNSNPIYHLASVAVVPEIKKCTSNNSASKGKEKRQLDIKLNHNFKLNGNQIACM